MQQRATASLDDCVQLSGEAVPTGTPAEEVLALDSFTKCYGEYTAVDSLTLTARKGEILCLLGANGAGKTTTIYALLGFVNPTSGAARVCGLDAHRHPLEVRRRIAYIPEVVVLYDHLTAVENVSFLCALGGLVVSSYAIGLHLESAGLAREFHARRVSTYSKGMRQKVGIALALARETRALILDEPLSGLDPKAAHEFGELLRQRAAAGSAVLMATHDLYRAREIAARIGILKGGKLVDLLDARELSPADLERIYLHHMRA
jgi:ABC-2 type transport system ATP-binding protein